MLELTRHDRSATVHVDHGPANALDTELCTELARTIRELDRDPDVAAIVLAGRPGVFCAGVDLKRLDGADDEVIEGFLAALDGLFRAVLAADTPLVAAVTGHAIAGGAVLAAGCDHAVVSDDTRVQIGLSELEVGVPFPTSAIEILRVRCGVQLAELVWEAELLGPARAADARLVDAIAPADDVVARAEAVAHHLATLPAATRELTRSQLWCDARERLAARAPTWEPQVVAGWCSADVRAAIARFVAERLR